MFSSCGQRKFSIFPIFSTVHSHHLTSKNKKSTCDDDIADRADREFAWSLSWSLYIDTEIQNLCSKLTVSSPAQLQNDESKRFSREVACK